MATGWLASFRDIKWSGALGMAPVLVERARRLWSRPRDDDALALEPAPEAVSAIEIRIYSLERRVEALNGEIVSSFEVVKAITDQHSALVQAVDVLLVRTQTLVRACALLALAVVAFALLALFR